jgi:uncharacterized OB-fold protein
VYDTGYWTDLLISFGMRLLVLSLFLITLRGLLKQVDPRNRAFSPDLVWLNLIPVFDHVWVFVTLVKARDSVRAEYRARDWVHRRDSSFGVGLVSAISYAAAEAFSVAAVFVDGFDTGWLALSLLATAITLIFWIAYWVKVSRLKQTLEYEAFVPAEETRAHCFSCGALLRPEEDSCSWCRSPAQPKEPIGTSAEQEPSEPAASGLISAEAGLEGCAAGEEYKAAGSEGAADAAGSIPTASLDEAAPSREAAPLGETCPFCGALYRPSARFCSCCGRAVV